MRKKVILASLFILFITLFPLKKQGDSFVQANQPEAHSFKAVTYNIHSGKNRSGERSIDAIAQLLEQEQADFIALQEVDRRRLSSGVEDQISVIANRLGMNYTFSPALRNGLSEYGNAILSRYPILSSGTLDLEGGKEHRILLWAKVYTERGSLYLTSVHLDTDRASRSTHFAKIQTFVDTKLNDAPVLLMGDLNTLYDNSYLIQLEYGLTGKYRDYEYPTFYHEKAGRSIQIDYIFGRDIIENEYYTISSNASDHIPLVLLFDIGKLPYMDSFFKETHTL